MDRPTDNLERLLVTLGEARQHGAFAGGAARYPWQNARAEAQSPRRRRFSWYWVGAPAAAAAAVAVVFVASDPFSRQAMDPIASNVESVLPPQHPEVLVVADTAPSTDVFDDCDYNGDGKVDGRDIQAFVQRRQGATEDAHPADAERFLRCLVNGQPV